MQTQRPSSLRREASAQSSLPDGVDHSNDDEPRYPDDGVRSPSSSGSNPPLSSSSTEIEKSRRALSELPDGLTRLEEEVCRLLAFKVRLSSPLFESRGGLRNSELWQ